MPLPELPTELLWDVTSYLPTQSLAQLCLTNKQLNHTITEPLYKEDGEKALLWAAKRGVNSTIETALRYGTDIDVKDNDGYSALLYAIKYGGFLSTVKLLLHNNASIDPVDQSALKLAVAAGHTDIVQLLLTKHADPNGEDYSALHIAALRGHLIIGKMLLDAGADPHSQTVYGDTPFILAVSQGHLAFAQWLLDLEPVTETSIEYIKTALHRAVLEGHLHVVEWLLEKKLGNFLETLDDEMHATPLATAVAQDRLPMVKLLLQHGADPSSTYGSLCPLAAAISGRQPDAVRLLFDYGAKILALDQANLQDVFLEIFQETDALLDFYLDNLSELPNCRSIVWQYCFLHSETAFGNAQLVRWCLGRAGVEVNTRCECGCETTALHQAIEHGHAEIVKFLLEQGADRSMLDARQVSAEDVQPNYTYGLCLPPYLDWYLG